MIRAYQCDDGVFIPVEDVLDENVPGLFDLMDAHYERAYWEGDPGMNGWLMPIDDFNDFIRLTGPHGYVN